MGSVKLLKEAILKALPKDHSSSNTELQNFFKLIRNYPERGGKHIRGQLVLLSCKAHGGSTENALEVAAALELFQNWVLIHDDIEDDSEERRGKPTLHRCAGMPLALNAGDALHVYMWQVLHHLESFEIATWRKIIFEFENVIQRTAEGQHLDLTWVTKGHFDITEKQYFEMVVLKTAYYTVIGPLRLGALCAKVLPNEAFTEAGKNLGIAFQIRDDVLNLMPEVSYGKEFAGDLYEAKRTLILAHTFSYASQAEHAEMQSILAKHRLEKTQEDINYLLGCISKYDSLAYAQSIAEERAKKGLTLLSEGLATCPNQPAVCKLTRLLESLVTRCK